MTPQLNRRNFLRNAAAAGFAVTAARSGNLVAAEHPVRIGVVGVGSRGNSHVRLLSHLEGVEITALCDVRQEAVDRAQATLKKAGHPKAAEYTRGPEDYKRLCDRNDLDAVLTATPWQLHTPVMVAAMEAGKYGATEVPAAVTLEENWQLVETYERTGVPCMMLENVNYFRNVMMLLVMLDQGLLGELLHCEGGYQHDVRFTKFGPDGNLLWRGEHSVHSNGNLYPTHPIGPIAQFLDINRGDRFDYCVSMSTVSRGLNHYVKKNWGSEHPNASRTYALGDINTTLIRTVKGRTITLYHDTQSARPYDLIFRVQGTEGIYSGTLDKIYIEGRSPKEHTWEDIDAYDKEYEHPMWTKFGPVAKNFGHGGGDYMCDYHFIKAVREKTQTPQDVYDAAAWSVITALTIESVANRSKPVDFPDFTKGKWKTRTPIGIVQP